MDLKELMEECRGQLLEVLSLNPEVADLSGLKKIYDQLVSLASSKKALIALSNKIETLISCSPEERFSAWLELNAVVERIDKSLLTLPKASKAVDQEFPFGDIESRGIRYSEVKHLVQALRMKSGARLSLVRESIILETYKSVQLLPYFVDNIDTRHSETADLIVREVIPYFGRACLSGVRGRVNFIFSVGQQRLLDVLLCYMISKEIECFSSEALVKGDLGYKKDLLKKVKHNQLSKDDLVPLLKSRSVELRDLATGLFEKYT